MNKKLPGVFVNKINKQIHNNKMVYYGPNEAEKEEEKETEEPINIRQKIRKLFQSTNYIYKLDVDIILKDKTITKRIIGYNDRDIITFDNERIPIENITNIYIKK